MNFNSASYFLTQTPDFLRKIFNLIERRNINLPEPHFIDHICLRTASEEDYQRLKKELFSFGELLIEAPVSGRLISTFKFNKPIIVDDYKIELIELPSPKAGKSYATELEHCEFVIRESFDSLSSRHKNLEWDFSGAQKKINPELCLKLDDKISIKFHHQSLEDVIALEKKPTQPTP